MSSITIENLPFPDLTGVTSVTFGGSYSRKRILNPDLLDEANRINCALAIERLDLKGVTTLTFSSLFNQPIEQLDLKGVTSLTFGQIFNQPIEQLDLKGVTTLTFGYIFNQPIERLDLKGVTTLTFGTQFNQPIEQLDLKGVTALTFGTNFNQPIERLNFKKVTVLTLQKPLVLPIVNHLFKLGFISMGNDRYMKLVNTPPFHQMQVEIVELKEQIATLTANINGLIHHLSNR